MIHTYHDPADSRSRFGVAWLFFAVWVLIAPILGLLQGSPSWAELAPAAMLSTFALFGFAIHRHERRECREIRLSDDGSCEFETRQRVLRSSLFPLLVIVLLVYLASQTVIK